MVQFKAMFLLGSKQAVFLCSLFMKYVCLMKFLVLRLKKKVYTEVMSCLRERILFQVDLS